jgi:hypothetical protein
VAAPKNPAVIDLKGKYYDDDEMHSIVEAVRNKGHDITIIRNIKDIGSKGQPQNQIVVTDPKILRRPEAKFDPDSFHLNDLLAAIGGLAVAGGAMKELNPDAK